MPNTRTSKSTSSIQLLRTEAFMPQGLPFCSMFLNRPLSSAGKSVSIITMCRRMSTKWSMCSMSTGHWFTHAPQVVHDHSASAAMTGSACARCPSGV